MVAGLVGERTCGWERSLVCMPFAYSLALMMMMMTRMRRKGKEFDNSSSPDFSLMAHTLQLNRRPPKIENRQHAIKCDRSASSDSSHR